MTLAEFFKGSETTLGVFYPNHHLIAVFRTPTVAESVCRKLRFAGFGEDQAIAATGDDVLELARAETSLGALLMQRVSSFFATEQRFTDADLEEARHGAGFLAVHCPTEQSKEEAWKLIQSADPLVARYYALSGIEHLAGDPDTD